VPLKLEYVPTILVKKQKKTKTKQKQSLIKQLVVLCTGNKMSEIRKVEIDSEQDVPNQPNLDEGEGAIDECFLSGDPDKPYVYVDSKGNAYHYYKNPLFKSVVFILGLELLERFSYYILQPEHNRYLTNPVFAGMSVTDASATIKLMSSLGYMWPILSAALCDLKLGLFNGILLFALIYAGALAFFTVSGSPDLYQSWMTPLFYYFWFPLGFGGIKSLISVMGANQYHPVIHANQISSFYVRFYVAINVGAFASTAVNIYATTVGDEMWKPFIIPACTFVVGIVVFLVANGRYVKRKPLGSAAVEVSKIACSSMSSCPPSLARQTEENGGKYNSSMVNDTRFVAMMIPLLAVCQLPFMLAYWLNDTVTIFQGMEMEETGGTTSAVLNSFINPICVVSFSLLADYVVYPFLERRNMYPSHLTKCMLGCACGCLSMLYGAGLNFAVKNKWTGNSDEGVSIFAQIPIYAFLALGEILSNPTAMDLAYSISADSLKAVALGINLLFSGMFPNLISGVLIKAMGGFLVDAQGCDSRTSAECNSIVVDGNGKPIWDYTTVRFEMVYFVNAVFPFVGIFLIHFMKPYYAKLMRLKQEQARANAAATTKATSIDSQIF